jgi:hypothetical protein
MSYKKGDVVVVKFPFVLKEGAAVIQKGRPAFVISVPEELISRKIGILPRSVVKDSERRLKRLLGFDSTSV